MRVIKFFWIDYQISYTIGVETDTNFFGHYFLHTNAFVEKVCEFIDLIKVFSLLNDS